jgi:nucleotide-binding universal stress UspA family protein
MKSIAERRNDVWTLSRRLPENRQLLYVSSGDKDSRFVFQDKVVLGIKKAEEHVAELWAAYVREEAEKDGRFTVHQEATGHPNPRWVIRFMGEWVGSDEEEEPARKIRDRHFTAQRFGEAVG